MEKREYNWLDRVDSPRDLKRLSLDELRLYCDELRHYIIEQCAVNPGHLASSLGAVELAAAIHYVFDTPDDRLVWDVGHQAYAHKIITGRREAFRTNRKLGASAAFRASPRVPTTLSEGAIRRSRSRPLSVWPRPPSCAARSGR